MFGGEWLGIWLILSLFVHIQIFEQLLVKVGWWGNVYQGRERVPPAYRPRGWARLGRIPENWDKFTIFQVYDNLIWRGGEQALFH